MRANRFLQPCVLLLLAGTMTAASGQPRPCSAVAPNEREAARNTGACTDSAPVEQISPKQVAPTPIITPIPNVVGLTFDDARDRLAGFSLRRTYRASAEPGGTVLEQQPVAPARVAAGAVVRVVLSDGTLRPAPSVPAAEVDQPPAPAAPTQAVVSEPDAAPGPVAPIATAPGSAREARPDGAQPGPATIAGARTRAPQVVGMPVAQAQARLADFRIVRIDRPSNAPIGEVIAQSPRSLESVALRQPITLIVSSGPANSARASDKAVSRDAGRAPAASSEPPKIAGPIASDLTNAMAEPSIERVEVPAAAPQARELTPDPPAGAPPPSGTPLPPQVSDASLAASSAPAPVAAPELAPATAPAASPVPPPPQTRVPGTFASSAALILGSGVLVGVLLGALLARRWFLKRSTTLDALVPEPAGLPYADAAASGATVTATPAATRFVARLDEGETTIEFTAPADLEADEEGAEMIVERSGDVHA